MVSRVATPSASREQTVATSVTKQKVRGKNQLWTRLCQLASNEDLRKWLKKSGSLKWTKFRESETMEGSKRYMRCSAAGCPMQLELLYLPTSTAIVVSSNNKAHQHGAQQPTGRGLSQATKNEVVRMFRSGVTRAGHIDERLQRLGLGTHSRAQLNAFLSRGRRQMRDNPGTLFGEEPAAADVADEYDDAGGDWVETADQDWGDGIRCLSAEEELEDSASPDRQRTFKKLKTATTPMNRASIGQLVASSITARERSYSPYSLFPVGAALLCADGTVFTGCNVENASYGLTNCAERTAVFKAVSEGYREFTGIAICAEMGQQYVGPCGACRQVLAEFNADMPVVLCRPDGQTKTTSMTELLPMPFLPNDVPFKN